MKQLYKDRIEQIRHGNVPEGYKKTAAGIMPITWRQVRIGDVCAVNPLRPKKQEERVTFLGMADVSEEGRLINPSIVDYTKVSKGFTPFERGDILVAKITPCFENGKGADTSELPTRQGYGSTEFHVLRCKDVDRQYMFLHTTSYELRKKLESEMTGSAGQKRVQTESISSYLLGLPSDKEQQNIANILAKQDRIIELKEKLLEEKQRQKKYLMQQLLTGKKRLPGFTEDWKTAPIGDFLESRNTKQVPSEEAPLMAFVAGEGVTLKGERYDRSHLVKDDTKKYKRTELDDFIYSSNNLDVGSIGLNKYGTAVISVVYEIFKMKVNVVPAVVSEVIQIPRNMHHILSYRQGAFYGQYRIFAEDFLSVPIRMPGYEEQVAIGRVLNAADREIELLRQDLEQEKQKKKALMQLLLTGIVRVNA